MGVYQNRIVVKIGTTTLMNGLDKADLRNTERLIRILSDISNMGYEIIVVSSGAIAAGVSRLGLTARPESMRMKQAVAAVGQYSLMHLYDRFFSDYGKTVAQILLSGDDINKEDSRRNLTNTIETLLSMGVIPIANENDSVNSEEIESEDAVFGDNDMLSAVVSTLCRAGKLIILADRSVMQACRTAADSAQHAGQAGRSVRRNAGSASTKLRAAETASAQGTDTFIIDGKDPDSIYEIIRGHEAGMTIWGTKS